MLLNPTMPGMCGKEVFEKIRGIRSDARVILPSGYSETALRDRCAGSGVAGAIRKPYQYESLAAVMAVIFRRDRG